MSGMEVVTRSHDLQQSDATFTSSGGGCLLSRREQGEGLLRVRSASNNTSRFVGWLLQI